MDAILFDFDGVILNSMPVRKFGFQEIFKSFAPDQVEALIKYHEPNGGWSRYVKIRYFFEEILGQPISEEEVNQWAAKYSAIMRQSLTDPKNLIRETVDFIESVYQQLPLHIVSGSDGEELRFLCEQLGVAKYFQSIAGSPTPKTQLVKNVLMNNAESNYILIGDSVNDYDSAIANNVRFYGYNNPALKGMGAGYIDSFREFRTQIFS